MKELIKLVCQAIVFVFCVVFFALSIVIPIVFVSQSITKARYGDQRYRVKVDLQTWYTNSYDLSDNKDCILFVDYFERKTVVCEKYSLEDNYWTDHSPSLTTVFFLN